MAKDKGTRVDFDTAMLPNRNDIVSGGKGMTVRTNVHPLNTFIDPGSLRTHREYDWQTGTSRTVSADVLDNAKRHMTRLTTCTVTSARTHPDLEDRYGMAGMSVPSTSKRSKKGR